MVMGITSRWLEWAVRETQRGTRNASRI